MPGFLYHLAFSELVLREHPELNTGTKRTDFLVGSVIPDLTIDKDISHFRTVRTSGWLAPSISQLKHDLPDKLTPILLGAYGHLWLDYHFITNYLAKNCYLTFGDRVINFYLDKIWDANDFLSIKGLYGAYDRGNVLLAQQGLLPKDMFDLPDPPPLTGFAPFDQRSEKSWKSVVQIYLESKHDEKSLDVIPPELLVEAVTTGAERFSKEIRYFQY